MDTMGSITTNCTSPYLGNRNESLCQFDPNLGLERLNGIEHPVGHIDKSISHDSANQPQKIDDDFEKLMEMVFEVGLLTIAGVAGVIGNFAAIVLFAR